MRPSREGFSPETRRDLLCLVGWVITQNPILQTLGFPFLLVFVLAALATFVNGLRRKN